jgi:hypothetical protein
LPLIIKMPAKKAAGKKPLKTKRASGGVAKKRTKKRTETFALYIYRVLK